MTVYLFCFVWHTNDGMCSRVLRAVASPTSRVHERRNVDDFLTLPGCPEMSGCGNRLTSEKKSALSYMAGISCFS